MNPKRNRDTNDNNSQRNGLVHSSSREIIKSIFLNETIPLVHKDNDDIHSGRNLPFLFRTLHRRFPPNITISKSLNVHIATVKNYDFHVKTHTYQRRRDIRCTLCDTKVPKSTMFMDSLFTKHSEYNPELVRTTDGRTHLLLRKTNAKDDNYNNCTMIPSRDPTIGISHIYYCHRYPFHKKSQVVAPNDISLPKRTYYESVSKKPKSDAIWLLDLDSDDEAQDHFRNLPMIDAEIDDYTDVTSGQKRFMKQWNYFLAHKSDGVTLTRKHVPMLCMEFAQYLATARSTCDDDNDNDDEEQQQFICFLFNLMDENHLGSLQMEQIMTIYRESLPASSVTGMTSSSMSVSD